MSFFFERPDFFYAAQRRAWPADCNDQPVSQYEKSPTAGAQPSGFGCQKAICAIAVSSVSRKYAALTLSYSSTQGCGPASTARPPPPYSFPVVLDRLRPATARPQAPP